MMLCQYHHEHYMRQAKMRAADAVVVDGRRVKRPRIPRVVELSGGARVRLDGRIPERIFLRGKWYRVDVNP